MPLLPVPSVSAVVWDAWTSNCPSCVNKGLFCKQIHVCKICVQKCTVLCCNCPKYHCGMTVSYNMHRDCLSLSNYLCSAQTLPEAALQLYCSHLCRTNTAVNRLSEKKYFLYLQLILLNFYYGSIIAFCRMKRGSAPATPRQVEFSSGQVCHFHSHLACLSFAPPELSRSKSLPAFCVTQRTRLLSAAYQEFLLRNDLPSKGKSITDNMSENGRFVYSVLCQSGEGDPAEKLFCLWSLHGKGRYKQGIAPRVIEHPAAPTSLLLGVRVQGTTAQYKDCGLVRWVGHLLPQKEIRFQI